MTEANAVLLRAKRIDEACDRFESQWRAGQSPRIDDFVAKVTPREQESLRAALQAVEKELKSQSAIDTSVSQRSVPTPLGVASDHTAMFAAPSELPKRIGRFEIRGTLGSGAFGKIYRGYDAHLGRDVAIKVPLAAAVKNETDRVRFKQEATAAATINHPNVCLIYEVGEFENMPYIVMPVIPGQSLADAIKTKKEPLPEKQVVQIVRKIASAIAAAHAKGIIHRDLKPANVMFDKERKDMIVMDFGLARGPTLGDARATQSGVILGTPAYMSPEQARGTSKDVGPAADIFSLGVIFYELLTGVRPFSGTATEVIGQILHVEPKAPSQHRPGIDPDLEAVCQKAMAKDPAARYRSMKELITALDATTRRSGTSQDARQEPKTKQEPKESTSDNQKLADVFAVISAERKATAAALEQAVARHRIPRWMLIALGLILVSGFTALGGIFFLTRTDAVKVTLKIDGVDLSDKTLAFFLDDKPILGEQLANPIELTPGAHIFVAKRGDDVVKRVVVTVPKKGEAQDVVYEVDPLLATMVVWKPLIESDKDLTFSREWNKRNRSTGTATFRDNRLSLRGFFDFTSDKFSGKNMVIRGRVVELPTNNFRCYVRRKTSAQSRSGYSAQIYQLSPGHERNVCDLGKMRMGESRQPMPSTTKRVADRLPYDFALAAYDNEISVYINGELILSAHEDEFKFLEGTVAITAWEKETVVLENLEYCVLDKTTLRPSDVIKSPLEAEIKKLLLPGFLTEEMKKGSLLKNGNFMDGTTNWVNDSWLKNPANYFKVRPLQPTVGYLLEIGHNHADSSSAMQMVGVKPNHWYLFSGWIKTKNLRFKEVEDRGAHLHVRGGYRLATEKLGPNNLDWTSNGDWTYYAVLFNSGGRTSVEVHAWLGYSSGTVTGLAQFKDLSLVELPDALTTSELFNPDRVQAPPPIAQKADEGFTQLFNGKDLSGWVLESGDSENWKVQDGAIVATDARGDVTKESNLLSEKSYGDFVARFEFMAENMLLTSGFAIRAVPGEKPTVGDPPRPIPQPHHLQVLLQPAEPGARSLITALAKTGDVIGNYDPQIDLYSNSIDEQKPVGQWNEMEVELIGQSIRVKLNGKMIQDANLDDLIQKGGKAAGLKRKEGRIGYLARFDSATFGLRNWRFRAIPIVEQRNGQSAQALKACRFWSTASKSMFPRAVNFRTRHSLFRLSISRPATA